MDVISFNRIQRTNSGFAAVEDVFRKIGNLNNVDPAMLYGKYGHLYEYYINAPIKSAIYKKIVMRKSELIFFLYLMLLVISF